MEPQIPEQARFAIPSFELDRIRLCFKNPSLEATFERETYESSLNFIRAYLVAGTVLYILFGILDVVVIGHFTTILVVIRYFIVCPILMGIFALSFTPLFQKVTQICLAMVLISSGLGIVAMTAIMEPPFNSDYYAGLIMVIIYCGSLIRLRYLYSLYILVLLFACYQVSCVLLNPIPFNEYISNNFFLMMSTGVGLFSSYIQELYIRQAYVGRKIIAIKNDEANHLLLESQKANKAKDEFLANMSHELRTPLNAIIGFSEILAHKMLGPLGNAKYEEYVDDIHQSGQHLLSIINDILDLAKAESGKVVLQEQEVEIAKVVDSCVRMCRERADNAHVKLRYKGAHSPAVVLVDERLIRQCVLNLLSNAVKFTAAGGEVTLSLEADRTAGVTIVVTDTGIGIAEEDLERVLRPFEQVESADTRQHGGTGLGLPYAKRLVELHGGTLDLKSKLGQGTTVTLRLPRTRVISGDELKTLGVAV